MSTAELTFSSVRSPLLSFAPHTCCLLSGFTCSQFHFSFSSSQYDKAQFVHGQFGFSSLHAHGCLVDSDVYYMPSTVSCSIIFVWTRLTGFICSTQSGCPSGYGYTSEADHVPMPMSGDSWNSFPRYPLPSDLQPNQRVVHTQVFKQIDVGTGSNIQKQLWVTEIDSEGTERLRRPELFFHGIVGHVKDKWGYPINGWQEASRIANYWRRYFDIDEVLYHFHRTEPHEHQSHQDNLETLAEDIPADDDGDDTSQMNSW